MISGSDLNDVRDLGQAGVVPSDPVSSMPELVRALAKGERVELIMSARSVA